MKKRVVSAVLIIVLLVSVLPMTSLAASSLSNFKEVKTYHDGLFTDVPSTQWYAKYVKLAYEYGLVNGKTTTTYEPNSYLTIAEAIKLAACLHSIYYTGSANFPSTSPWYQPYVDYALSEGIITSSYANYNAAASRADFALIFAHAFPEEALTEINDINDGDIPDVSINYSYGDEVYLLYRAGVLAGNDSAGTYYPNSNIKRSEVATIAARMANTEYRMIVTLTGTALTASEIFAKCSPAVFYIELYDKNGTAIQSGSGFFISSSGLAVTNYHVIDGAASAKIRTSNGTMYNVLGVCSYSEENDLAILQISGSGFTYLDIGDSRNLVTGANIYAIGSPLGLENTLTNGIISSASRTIDGLSYIQISAPISAGSSGGALLNTRGQVIGVTSASYVDGQNLNLAVPIHMLEGMSKSSYVTLESLLPNISYYSGYYPAPDFGAAYNAPIYLSQSGSYSGYPYRFFLYKMSDLPVSYSTYYNGYCDILEQCGFEFYEQFYDSYGNLVTNYYNYTYGIDVFFGAVNVSGVNCFEVDVWSYN